MNSTKDIILLADRIAYKPLSVNKAWQGKRFKSKDYQVYEKDMLMLLNKRVPDFKKQPLEVYLKFGFSNSASDIDNCVKPFLDILQKKYGFNDSQVLRMILEKQLVPKGDEFVEFRIMKLPPDHFAVTENSKL